VPAAVAAAIAADAPAADPPARLLQFIGGGNNQWTAAEGALKIRETAYVAAQGLALEQFLHGPSVALREHDRLVCLDGGGVWAARAAEIARAAERSGVPVTRLEATGLGETLSIFPLTVAVQRIALDAADALGTNADSFGRDVPGREPWLEIQL
jgi:glucosamine--fructose-6-phosphate aminotransferase (isomerizing)